MNARKLKMPGSDHRPQRTKKPGGLYDWSEKTLSCEDYCFDFDDCPPREATYGLWYECQREFVSLRESALGWKKLPKSKKGDANFTVDAIISAFIQWFPETPWLAIPSEQREQIVESLTRRGYVRLFNVFGWGSAYTDGLGVASAKNLKSGDRLCWHRREQTRDRDVSYLVFKINWQWTDEMLRDGFYAWLREKRPKDTHPHDPRLGRGGPRDWLSKLGARRSLMAYGVAEAERRADKIWPGKVPYSDQTAWRRAALSAKRFLLRMAGQGI